jgi:hypothetical protein
VSDIDAFSSRHLDEKHAVRTAKTGIVQPHFNFYLFFRLLRLFAYGLLYTGLSRFYGVDKTGRARIESNMGAFASVLGVFGA